MLEEAKGKARMMAAVPGEVAFVQGDAQELPFADSSFDTVVDTFSLCVYADPVRALAEMARVTRPGVQVAHRIVSATTGEAARPRQYIALTTWYLLEPCYELRSILIRTSDAWLLAHCCAHAEMSVITAAGGKILLLEHSRSDIGALAAYQDFTATSVAAVSKGCFWNQQLPAMMKDAGLYVMSQQRHLAGTVSLVTAINTVP